MAGQTDGWIVLRHNIPYFPPHSGGIFGGVLSGGTQHHAFLDNRAKNGRIN